MKLIYHTVICSLLMLFVSSCADDPMQKEQYKKEIYLVGAFNRVWTIDVAYSNEKVENFFTISSSGTLPLDKDVQVAMTINEDLVASYNDKFLGELNVDKFFEPLDKACYTIPTLENATIEYQKGISVDVPVLIETKNLLIDHRYVIPVQITVSNPYEVSESGRKMLIQLNLINDYSGDYQMDGHMTERGGNPRRIQKSKVLTANGINSVRLFYAMNNESSKKEDIASKTIEITISDEFKEGSSTIKNATVKGWGSFVVTDSGVGTYNTVTKEFHIVYSAVDTGVEYEETLTAAKD